VRARRKIDEFADREGGENLCDSVTVFVESIDDFLRDKDVSEANQSDLIDFRV
jgi:hypothetical protein